MRYVKYKLSSNDDKRDGSTCNVGGSIHSVSAIALIFFYFPVGIAYTKKLQHSSLSLSVSSYNSQNPSILTHQTTKN